MDDDVVFRSSKFVLIFSELELVLQATSASRLLSDSNDIRDQTSIFILGVTFSKHERNVVNLSPMYPYKDVAHVKGAANPKVIFCCI